MSDPDLYVDVDALQELARQLQNIKSALDDAGKRVDAFDARLGSHRIEDALDDFIGGWKDGRKEITEAINGLFDAVSGSVNTYLENEARLSKAAGAGG
jgi:hypothetical protein